MKITFKLFCLFCGENRRWVLHSTKPCHLRGCQRDHHRFIPGGFSFNIEVR